MMLLCEERDYSMALLPTVIGHSQQSVEMTSYFNTASHSSLNTQDACGNL